MPDVSTITNALTAIKTATEIATFFRGADLSLKDAEAKMKIADLVTALADVKIQVAGTQQELLEKNDEIKSLKAKLEAKSQLKYENPFYWRIDGEQKDGPFCQQCQDSSQKLVRLQNNGYTKGCWKCSTCENVFKDGNYETQRVSTVRSSSNSWMQF